MTLVVDASVVVAALLDRDLTGVWAEQQLVSDELAAPHLLPLEVVNVLRREEAAGTTSPDVAALAHADLLDLSIELYPYDPFAHRVWELRPTITAYDAWYVALAETLGARLATIDRRLATAPGPGCEFIQPPRHD
jgi:predicted nucleic acid-binding protein